MMEWDYFIYFAGVIVSLILILASHYKWKKISKPEKQSDNKVYETDGPSIPFDNTNGDDDLLELDCITEEDISIEHDDEDETDHNISPQAMADIQAELMETSILSEDFDDESFDPATSVEVCDRNEDSPTKTITGRLAYESHAQREYNKLSRTLSPSDLEAEQRIQQEQLNNILQVMQQHPEMFGDAVSYQNMQEQASSLYCGT